MKLPRKSRWLRLSTGVGFTNTNPSTQENKLQSWVLTEDEKMSWLPVAAVGTIVRNVTFFPGTFCSAVVEGLSKGSLMPPTFWLRTSPDSYNMSLHLLFHSLLVSIFGKESVNWNWKNLFKASFADSPVVDFQILIFHGREP